MGKKILVFVVIAAIAALFGFLVFRNKTSAPPATPAPQKENIVSYTDNGFEPKSLTIKAGETVMFKNNSSNPMWVASAFHPTHKEYPMTGGCIGSTFDACKNFNPGESWSFKFDIIGSWKYHNHSNTTHFGTIVVEK